MSSLSTTYLIPAILLNPAFILHLINTFFSHLAPPPHVTSHSPHPFMESLGPVPGSTPHLDMHADDQLCWRYTAIMVIVQMLAFGRVQDNRVRKKSARAAKLEEKRLRQEERLQMALASAKANGHSSAFHDTLPTTKENGYGNLNDQATALDSEMAIGLDESKLETESEDSSSVTETSEEEMIL